MKADAPEEVADLDKKYNFPVRIREEQALYRLVIWWWPLRRNSSISCGPNIICLRTAFA
nr:hypothetical protein [Verrucomicrobium spinosum]